MCNQKIIDKIDRGEAIIFTKLRFYLSLFILFATVISSFALMKYKIDENTKKIDEFQKKISGIDEIRYNLKSLCEKNGVKYIEIKR